MIKSQLFKALMFGLFTKNTLSLPQRATLMLSLVHAFLMGYVKHRQWLAGELRATVVENWLARNGGSAGTVFRAKISIAADGMARHLVATMDDGALRELLEFLDHAARIPTGQDPAVDRELFSLLSECEKVLVVKGLAT